LASADKRAFDKSRFCVSLDLSESSRVVSFMPDSESQALTRTCRRFDFEALFLSVCSAHLEYTKLLRFISHAVYDGNSFQAGSIGPQWHSGSRDGRWKTNSLRWIAASSRDEAIDGSQPAKSHTRKRTSFWLDKK